MNQGEDPGDRRAIQQKCHICQGVLQTWSDHPAPDLICRACLEDGAVICTSCRKYLRNDEFRLCSSCSSNSNTAQEQAGASSSNWRPRGYRGRFLPSGINRRCLDCGKEETVQWRHTEDRDDICNACYMRRRLARTRAPGARPSSSDDVPRKEMAGQTRGGVAQGTQATESAAEAEPQTGSEVRERSVEQQEDDDFFAQVVLDAAEGESKQGYAEVRSPRRH